MSESGLSTVFHFSSELTFDGNRSPSTLFGSLSPARQVLVLHGQQNYFYHATTSNLYCRTSMKPPTIFCSPPRRLGQGGENVHSFAHKPLVTGHGAAIDTSCSDRVSGIFLEILMSNRLPCPLLQRGSSCYNSKKRDELASWASVHVGTGVVL